MQCSLPALRSSGELLADRRYIYAQATAAQGDYAAAADLLMQTLELVPDWAPAWFALGLAHAQLDAAAEAAAAFRRAMSLDPADELGAALHLARLGALALPASAPDGYVRGLFDQYADRFDAHLTAGLGYRAPALLAQAVQALDRSRFARVVDLGCGTGLCGEVFRGMAGHLTGVDLSPRMIEVARAKAIYDDLQVKGLVDFLAGEDARSIGLILAADVLVYIGDLDPVFAAAARVLADGGLFAFTLQRGDAEVSLGADIRFAHAPAYVAAVAAAAGLTLVRIDDISTRRDAGRDVPGLLVIAERG